MHVELEIPGADSAGRVFLTWAPVRATARVVDATGAAPVSVTFRSAGPTGQLRFATTRTHRGTSTLDLRLPATGARVPFFVAGAFGQPSSVLNDAGVEVRAAGAGTILGQHPVTVRVRKDATTLSDAERDRFLAALGALNNRGRGRFRDFREMHVATTLRESHGNVGFLSWHRAYLLDLERELQAIDPRVTLPYWRFDRPAPRLFDPRFLGRSGATGRVTFTPGHPLEGWSVAGTRGITRLPLFATGGPPPLVISEAATLALGGPRASARYAGFVRMEGNPHADAHNSFAGVIQSPATSPQDPLFFLLHANVDRLWAMWQWFTKRTSPADPDAFTPARNNQVGHRLNDTMWPWNGVTTGGRPSVAPGGGLAPSPTTTAPGPSPTVGAMLDFQAVAGGSALGFAYDDVPFEN